MTTANLTQGQKEAIFTSLANQYKSSKSTMTAVEVKVYKSLRDELAKEITLQGSTILVINGYAKEINLDTFGEDYRMNWTRIRENSKGEYFFSAYQGKRIYLN